MRQNKINKVDWQILTPNQAKAKIQDTGKHGFCIGDIKEKILAGKTVFFDFYDKANHPNFLATLANLPSEYEIHVGMPSEGYTESEPVREIGEYCILNHNKHRGSWNVYHQPNLEVISLLDSYYGKIDIYPYLIGVMLVTTSGRHSLAYSVDTCEKILEILFAPVPEASPEILALVNKYKDSDGPLATPKDRFRLACDLVHTFFNLTK